MNISSLLNRRVLLIPAMMGAILTLGGGAVLAAPGGQSGTTLSAYKTAEGFWKQLWEYDWSVIKVVDPLTHAFHDYGEVVEIVYTIEVTPSGPTRKADSYGAEGEVCVTNGGERATEGLQIADDILYEIGSGKFKVLYTSPVDISEKPALAPGESYCYPYKIPFSPVSGAKYKNSVKVTITNHSGHMGENFGPSPDASFSLPSEPELVYLDESAILDDVLGDTSMTEDFVFDFAQHYGFPMEFNVDWVESGVGMGIPIWITYYGECEEVFTLFNTATLTETDTGQVHESLASLVLQGPVCGGGGDEPTPVGCTRTQGYWKTHGPEGCRTGKNANDWPVAELQLGNYIYINSDLCAILKQPVKGNGLLSLAHQLITAKLNVASGTSPNPTATIAQADLLIGNLMIPPVGTGELNPTKTSPYTSLLDMFNNGDADYDSNGDIDGPPHCD